MSSLKTEMLKSIRASLNRKAIEIPATWAERCRVMGQPFPGPWSFKHHPWLRDMHNSTATYNVGQKSAQAGFTETGINIAFYTIDMRRVSVMYVLPSKTPDATDFSSSRFDPALELSPYLSKLFNDTKNIGLKRSGNVCLYIRGSRSRSGLKSVPAGMMIFDEVDEMNRDAITLGLERQSGQMFKQTWLFSTPTIDDYGINLHYKNSSQEHFFFKCRGCGRLTELVYPDCLVITGDDWTDPNIKKSYLQCKECRIKIEHEHKWEILASGIWVPGARDKDMRGFHVNQLYSSTITPGEFAIQALKAQSNPADEQEFYNSKLGLPRTVDGARVTEAQIEQCVKNYGNGSEPVGNKIVTIGIDVGKWLHYCVVEWSLKSQFDSPDINMNARARVLEIAKVLHFEDLDTVITRYRPHMTVIDANPERRKAFELAQRFWGFVKLAIYGNSISGKTINVGKDDMENLITLDRTSWLDMTLSRFAMQSISLPKDVSHEFRDHIKALARHYHKDDQGNPVGSYVNTADDHYAHALNYAEIALKQATEISSHRSI